VTGLDALAGESFCYLTTTGRVTGRPHTIEIWFGLHDGAAYLLSGGRERSDWVRNLRRNPAASLRLGERTFPVQARILEAGSDEDAFARRLLLDKYAPSYGGDLSTWGVEALAVALDLALPGPGRACGRDG
jgi:deazaflavin-dependent oxidoreductase (nitroreductase family)